MMNITDMDSGPCYYTSYRVSHDALGKLRGDGVPHQRKLPPRLNVITGNQLDLNLYLTDLNRLAIKTLGLKMKKLEFI